MKKIFNLILVILFVGIPLLVSAQGFGGLVTCSGASCDFNDLIKLLVNIFSQLVKLGIIFSSIAFAYAGFLYITSQGDASKISRATKIFTNFAVGLFLLLSSFLIIQLILTSLGLDSIFSSGFINLRNN